MGFLHGVGNFLTFGAVDRCQANSIIKDTKNREENARDSLEIQKSNTNTSLCTLGNAKQNAFSNSLSQFISLYKVIGKVDISPIKNLDKDINYRQFKLEYSVMKKISTSLKEIALVSGGGVAVGAAAVGGAMGLATLIGTASTGTAIGSLSGVAATNATLAWLGGGTLSAGGAGAAGGMVVLGGIAVAPLAIFGMFLGANKGTQKLNAAKNYRDEIDVLIEKINTLIIELQKIERGAKIFTTTVVSLEQLMMYQNELMSSIILRLNGRPLLNKYFIDPIKKVFNMQVLTDEECTIFRNSANCAVLLKQICDTSLITGEGAFMEDALVFLQEKTDKCNALLSQASMPQLDKAV